MTLLMASINYKNSNIENREKLCFNDAEIGDICKKIFIGRDIYGCVILSTCNRTEIYLSCADDSIKAGELLLEALDINNNCYEFENRSGDEVVYYIMELACGLKSQILGDGQIAGQLNNALTISRECGCSDAVLNTLFRIAVSAGKYSLTNNKITNVPLSSAYAAVELIRNKYGSVSDKRFLVVGNGKMGKIVIRQLLDMGAEVWVTMRNYKHGNNEVITGCKTVNYSERYAIMDKCDFVISATKSPHYTLTYDKFSELKKMPAAVIDLAVPRDIESRIGELCRCYNLDDLRCSVEIDKDKLGVAYAITKKYADDFIKWQNYKLSLPEIEDIKTIITKRIVKNMQNEIDVNNLQKTVEKTVDIMLGSMKEFVLPNTMHICKRKIEERARL